MIYVIIIKIIANQIITNLKSLVEQSESSETVSRYINKSLNFRTSGQIDVTRKNRIRSNLLERDFIKGQQYVANELKHIAGNKEGRY